MKRSSRWLLASAVAVLTAGGGSFAQQAAVPEIPYDSVPNLLKGFPPDTYLGEAAGVATNSQGHIFVFTRTGSVHATLGTERTFVRGNGGARLFEFDQTGKYVRELGQGLYGFTFAQAVRVDPQDNIWTVDEGSNMIVEFNPQGQVVMTLGRRPESLTVPGGSPQGGRGGGGGALPGAGVEGETFNRPADVAWDRQGNIFIADGYGNSRVIEFDRNGVFVRSWGSTGSGPGQFDDVSSIATDREGNVYVGDMGNHRIQVFDNGGTLKTSLAGVGAPRAICITPGPHQYLYSSNSNDVDDFDRGGEIYKLELDGRIVGKFGKPGKLMKEFGTVNGIDCRNDAAILVGELTNWRVQKIELHPGQAR